METATSKELSSSMIPILNFVEMWLQYEIGLIVGIDSKISEMFGRDFWDRRRPCMEHEYWKKKERTKTP